MAILLLGSVVLLPLLIRDDGTARGFIQIMLTYTLSVITALLGFSTLWLACGTLARDIEDCSIQMLVVKPISRWQIWLGKFIGIMLLNAVLLALAGLSVYFLLQWRSRQLDPRERVILRNEIFVARASLKEAMPDIEGTVDAAMQKVLRESPMSPQQQDETRRLLREDVRSRHQVVPPDHLRRWTIDLGLLRHTLRDTPMFLRVKFNAAQTNENGSYLGLWNIGPPNTPQVRSLPQSLAADTFHEIQIPPNLFD
ncbi:MAG TPA: ABC transporter permease subunit, partial [Candidatus Dormibacteraeota bacterium]|nr:ABC transporter permease subunit [Candidatus Dormibacteraeota bacterium]